MASGVLYANGDQYYTGNLTFNSGDFRITRSGGDYSITAGNTEAFAFVATKDNEILTLGGLKAREEAEGAPLRLNVTNNKMTANTTVEVENNSRLSLKIL